MNTPRRIPQRTRIIGLICLLSSGGLFAQQIPAEETTSAAKNKAQTATSQVAGAAAAQSAAGGSGQAKAGEDVVELNPFVVSSDKDVGYMANETLAGSRFGTRLADTPSTLSVMTTEFLSDIGAFNLTDALRYSTNTELALDDDRENQNGQATVYNYQSYRMRGLASTQTRNYFDWGLPANTYNVERIEESRGPNSVLFGIASPGGTYNVQTKRAQATRSFESLSLTSGSNGTYRGGLDVNRTLIRNKLALRINLIDENDKNFRQWQFDDYNMAHIAVTYDVARRLQVRGEFEFGQVDSNRGRTFGFDDYCLSWINAGRPTYAKSAANSTVGISKNSTSSSQPRVTYFGNEMSVIATKGQMVTNGGSTGGDGVLITDPNIIDYSVNPVGPGANRYSRFNATSVYADFQVAPKTFVELAYNNQWHNFDRYDPGQTSSRLFGDPNQYLGDGTANPHAGQLYVENLGNRRYQETLSDSVRLMLSTEYNAKKWGNYRVGVYYDYSHSYLGYAGASEIWVDAATGAPAFNTTPENSYNRVYRRRYVTENAWSTYYADTPFKTGLLKNVTDPVTGRTLSSAWVGSSTGGIYESYTDQKTLMAAGQAYYFSNRLVLAGGVRRDSITTHQLGTKRDSVTGQIVQAHTDEEATGGTTCTYQNICRTKTLGAVYHVMPWFSLSANYSDNIQPAAGSLVLPPSGLPGQLVPAELPRGVGKDYGVTFTLFDGRLSLRALYFDTESRYNRTTFSTHVRDANTLILDTLLAEGLITQSEYDTRNNVGTTGQYSYKSTGYEFEATANITKNFRLQSKYSVTDAVQSDMFLEWKAWDKQNVQWLSKFDTKNIVCTGDTATIAEEVAYYQSEIATDTASDGVQNLGSRRYKVSVFGRYDLPWEKLKGVYVGGGYYHQSKIFTGVDTAGKPVYGNSYWRADVMAGYRFKYRKGRTASIQLNIKNVFNQHDPLVNRYNDNGTITRWVIQDPISWQVTTNIDF